MSRRTVRVWGWTLVAAGVLGFPADAPARGVGGGFHGGGFHGGGFHGGGFHPGGFHAGGFHPGGFRGFGGVPASGFHHYGGIGGGVPRWSPGIGGGLPGGTAGLRGFGGFPRGLEGNPHGGFHRGPLLSYTRPAVGGLGTRAAFNDPFRAGGGRTLAASRIANFNPTNVNVNRNLFVNRSADLYGGWNRGYWNGHWGRWGGNWGWYRPWGGYGYGYGYPYGYPFGSGLLGLGLGLGLGWGLSTWGLGAWPFYYGYMPYYNPYYAMAPATVVVQDVNPVVVNYSQPIAVNATPPPSDVEVGVALFDQARAAFKAGDYDRALQLADQALAKMPNDLDLHEFRAVVQFARGQYREAAAGLYAVLSVAPGWNWPTLIGLYPDVDTFTRQLRALESYVTTHPQDASARFVLAYLYITMGVTDAAVTELKAVVQLVPKDWLSSQLLRELEGNVARADSAATTPPEPAGGPTPGPAEISGRWTAQAAQNGTVTLDLRPDGTFTWTYTTQGRS
ncbi:MAG: hypothetical protein QOE66_1212, partial [Chloroflexota bacterium]|nr:hypothetical protein [Chloroflexota bacterium]